VTRARLGKHRKEVCRHADFSETRQSIIPGSNEAYETGAQQASATPSVFAAAGDHVAAERPHGTLPSRRYCS